VAAGPFLDLQILRRATRAVEAVAEGPRAASWGISTVTREAGPVLPENLVKRSSTDRAPARGVFASIF
jgi:hypothetical protein